MTPDEAFCTRPVRLDHTVRFAVPRAFECRSSMVRVYDAEGRLVREINPFVKVVEGKRKGARAPQPLWPEKKGTPA